MPRRIVTPWTNARTTTVAAAAITGTIAAASGLKKLIRNITMYVAPADGGSGNVTFQVKKNGAVIDEAVVPHSTTTGASYAYATELEADTNTAIVVVASRTALDTGTVAYEYAAIEG